MEKPPEYELITDEGLEALKGDCQDIVNFARKNFNVELSFDDKSVMWLSSFIEAHREKMDAEERHNSSVKIGIFLGFAIIDRHGGDWVITEGNDIAVKFPSGAMAFPFNKASKQFENGIVDNIYGLYRNMGVVLQPNGLASARIHQIGGASSNEPAPAPVPKKTWWQFWR
jgi:hypothetical protein